MLLDANLSEKGLALIIPARHRYSVAAAYVPGSMISCLRFISAPMNIARMLAGAHVPGATDGAFSCHRFG